MSLESNSYNSNLNSLAAFDLKIYQASKPYFFTEKSPFKRLDGSLAEGIDPAGVVGGNSEELMAYLKGFTLNSFIVLFLIED